MRRAYVYHNDQQAGILAKDDQGNYIFSYTEAYCRDEKAPPVSLTLPKRMEAYHSDHLFAFFFNLLPEGTNKHLQCHALRIDEADDFSLLLAVAGQDTIGAVRVVPAENLDNNA